MEKNFENKNCVNATQIINNLVSAQNSGITLNILQQVNNNPKLSVQTRNCLDDFIACTTYDFFAQDKVTDQKRLVYKNFYKIKNNKVIFENLFQELESSYEVNKRSIHVSSRQDNELQNLVQHVINFFGYNSNLKNNINLLESMLKVRAKYYEIYSIWLEIKNALLFAYFDVEINLINNGDLRQVILNENRQNELHTLDRQLNNCFNLDLSNINSIPEFGTRLVEFLINNHKINKIINNLLSNVKNEFIDLYSDSFNTGVYNFKSYIHNLYKQNCPHKCGDLRVTSG